MSGAVKIFNLMHDTVEKHAETSLRLDRALVPPIGITRKKFEENISRIDPFIEIFVTRENYVPLIFPPFLPFI